MLKDATSHGLYDRVWPPHTIERRGGRLTNSAASPSHGPGV